MVSCLIGKNTNMKQSEKKNIGKDGMFEESVSISHILPMPILNKLQILTDSDHS